jgi:hypothetical protein
MSEPQQKALPSSRTAQATRSRVLTCDTLPTSSTTIVAVAEASPVLTVIVAPPPDESAVARPLPLTETTPAALEE